MAVIQHKLKNQFAAGPFSSDPEFSPTGPEPKSERPGSRERREGRTRGGFEVRVLAG